MVINCKAKMLLERKQIETGKGEIDRGRHYLLTVIYILIHQSIFLVQVPKAGTTFL